MNEITITSSLLPIRELNGQRVVTFRDIDTVHERTEGTAKRNFNANRKHFIEGVDFFKVCADEIRTHKIVDLSPKAHEDITLLTESGYLMIVKSFTDDLSWDVQRMLVNNYFKSKGLEALEQRVKLLEEKLDGSAKPAIQRDTSRDQNNADYLLDKLLKQPKRSFRKYEVLRMCRKLSADDLTAAILVLSNSGILQYTIIRQDKGRPIQIIELMQ